MKKKMRLYSFMLLLFSISMEAFAQIKYTNERVYINDAPSSAYGLNVKNWAGMYWRINGKFFQMDLTPANPRLAGTGDQVVFYNTQTGVFNSIQVANVYNYSDARAKDNVQTLTTGLDLILSLRPVSYKWKKVDQESVSLPSAIYSEVNDSSMVAYGPMKDDRIQYGFLAQEVENILPDAVLTDEGGNKMINYTTIIPLLVQAVQELQSSVKTQAQIIEQLSNVNLLGKECSVSKNKIISCLSNPTNDYVTISTQLNDNVSVATLLITSVEGNKEKVMQVSLSRPSVSEDISSLKTGVYFVSLFVDGTLADSRRLVKK